MLRHVDINKQAVLQAVATAIRLDGEGQMKEAFLKYMECIQQIARVLHCDATETDEFVSNNSKQLMSLCRRCVDRANELISHMPDKSVHHQSSTAASVEMPHRPTALLPVDPAKESIASRSTKFSASNFDARSPTSPVQTRTAVELAKIQNDQLLAVYMSRIHKTADRHAAANLSLAVQRRMAENMAIAKQRQLALEKKRQEHVRQLMEETERRFSSRRGMTADEVERRRIYTQILQYEHDVKWLLNIRRAMSTLYCDCDFVRNTVNAILRTPEHPLTQLFQEYRRKSYESIQEACQNVSAIEAQLRSAESATSVDHANATPCQEPSTPDNCHSVKPAMSPDVPPPEHLLVDESSEDDVAGKNLNGGSNSSDARTPGSAGGETELRSDNAHPLTNSGSTLSQLLSKLRQEKVSISHELAVKIQSAVNRLETMFTMAYEELDCNTLPDDVQHELRKAVEKNYFDQLWLYLTDLYRLSVDNKQQSLSDVMKSYASVAPQDLGIGEKLTLMDESADSGGVSQPYLSVIELMRTIPDLVSPIEKVETIGNALPRSVSREILLEREELTAFNVLDARSMRLICECVDNYYSKSGSPSPGIGADELLPILSYIVIRTQLPQLAVECATLMDFIDEKDLIGEVGYCLASMQTAIGYVQTLPLKST